MHIGTSLHKASQENFKQKIHTAIDIPKARAREVAVESLKSAVAIDGVFLSPEEEKIGKKSLQNDAEQDAITFADLYIDSVAPKYQPLEIEVKKEIPIPHSTRTLLGIIDTVTRDNQIIDLKSRRKKADPVEFEKSPQMAIYSLIHHAKTGQPPKEILVEVLIKKTESEVQTISVPAKTADDYEALLLQMSATIKAIEAEAFVPSYGQMGAWWCSPKSCGYWRSCLFVPKHRRGEAG